MKTQPTSNPQTPPPSLIQELRTLLGDPKKTFQERLEENNSQDNPHKTSPTFYQISQSSEQVMKTPSSSAFPKTIQSLLNNTKTLQDLTQKIFLQLFENIFEEKTLDTLLKPYLNNSPEADYMTLKKSILEHKEIVLKELKMGLTAGLEQGMQEGVIQGLTKGLITGLKKIEISATPGSSQSEKETPPPKKLQKDIPENIII